MVNISTVIATGDQYFIDVSTRKRWSRKSVQDAGLLSDELRKEIFEAYKDIGKEAALLYDNLYFYEYIVYTVKEDNGDKTRIHIRVGDIVDVTEEQEGLAYAQVKGIILHKYNDGTLYPFFVFDWFSSTLVQHNVLQCTIYRLQGQNDN